MRIMVFMTRERETSVPPTAFKMKTHVTLSARPLRRWFHWLPGAVVYGWIAVSAQATVNPWVSQSRPASLSVVTFTLAGIPGQEALYPVLGLLAAVASTFILRRRRIAQLDATAANER